MIKYKFSDSESDGRLQIDGEYIDLFFKYRIGSFLTEHTHDFYEIMVLKKNSLVNIVDGVKTHMTAPMITLIYPHNVHTVEYFNEDGVPEFYNITINKEFFEQISALINQNYKDKLTENAHYFLCDMHLHKNVVEQLDKALSLPKSALTEQHLLLKNVVVKLLTEYFTFSDSQEPQSDTIKQILYAMSIPKNMTMKFYELAHLVGYSPEHIIRMFSKNNLPTPNTMFTQIKLDYSCTLLSSTDYHIPYIAEAIGISDVSYFNKLFKKQYGVSPTAYRKMHTPSV